MSDHNTIFEINKLMNDKGLIKNDLDEITHIIKEVIQQKYISKFEVAIDEQRELVKKNTPKEINLLLALKPYLEQSTHTYIDQIIDLIYKMNTVKNIQAEIEKCAVVNKMDNNLSNPETTIHDDGIYEIDTHCTVNNTTNSMNITELIFMLLVTGIM